jgi:hypothetical protein
MKIKSSLLTLASAILLTLLTQPVRAQSPESGLRAFAGFKALNLGDQRFWHNTHPGDSFLPDSDVPGSAGVTDVGGMQFCITLGGEYQKYLSDSFSLTLGMGIMYGGDSDRHQNDNDPRPASSGSFVYSETDFGWCVSTALSWHAGKFYAGVEAQLASVRIESGWDRFGHYERQRGDYKYFISAGPRIGWAFTKSLLVEGTVQFDRGAAFGIKIIWMHGVDHGY